MAGLTTKIKIAEALAGTAKTAGRGVVSGVRAVDRAVSSRTKGLGTSGAILALGIAAGVAGGARDALRSLDESAGGVGRFAVMGQVRSTFSRGPRQPEPPNPRSLMRR